MHIQKVRLKRRAVEISYKNNGEEHNITSRDMNMTTSVRKLLAKGRVRILDNRAGANPILPKAQLALRTKKRSRKAYQARVLSY